MKLKYILLLSVLIGVSFAYFNRDNHLNNQKSSHHHKKHRKSNNRLSKTKNHIELIESQKPEFDTIQNCQVYNNEESCALCKPGTFLTDNNKKCKQGKISNCIEYLSETSCAKCKNGYRVTSLGNRCKNDSDYFDDGDLLDNNESGINWDKPSNVPKSNQLPDGENWFNFDFDFFNLESSSDETEALYNDGESEVQLFENDLFGDLEEEEEEAESDGESQNIQEHENQPVDDGEEDTPLELLEQNSNQQKLTAFMSLFDNKY